MISSNFQTCISKAQLYFILLFVIIGCKNSSESNNPLPSKEKLFKGEIIFENKYNIQNVYFCDDYIVVKNIANKESNVFSVYKNDTALTHISDFGRIGNGPNEFESEVYCTTQFDVNKEGKFFWVYEMNKNKVSQIDLTETIRKKSIVVKKFVKLKPELSLKEMFYVEENKIIGNPDNLSLSMDQLVIFNDKTGIVEKRLPFAFNVNNEKSNDINFTQQNFNTLFVNNLRFNRKRNKLVSGMVTLDRIDILNLNGTINKSTETENVDFTSLQENIKNTRIYCSDLYAGDAYIYVLFSGEEMNKYFEESTPTKVKIYDWNLNLKHVLKTEESLNFITINEKSKTLIGTSITQEKIVKYNLENIL
ncbi:MAG: TolB-like 6-bladed beta-propeller domain-containing protein [Tenacibaculum sp.]|nr:TolB-like 6-bladed beta-propeller domain-containing protein [Tenacibaculum sp.]